MRTLALDFGERRIGVAITDATGSLAQPLETIDRKRSGKDADFERIDQIVKKYSVTRIVIGLPLHMNGHEGPEARNARAFGSRIEKQTGIEPEFLDERWTSIEAEQVLRNTGGKSRKDRGRVDRVAATILLQAFLERSAR